MKELGYFFIIITLFAIGLLVNSVWKSEASGLRRSSLLIFFVLMFWFLLQGFLSYNGIYSQNLKELPPKIFVIGIFPMIALNLIVFFHTKGKLFIDNLPLKELTFLNILRIPIEIVLYKLFLYKQIPEVMTFTGRNFDILAGLSAPLIIFLVWRKNQFRKVLLLIWNFFALALLINIVSTAILSSPSAFQQFGFDQPNIAILNFPFSFLPTVIVPIVFFGHFVSIRQLWNQK